MLTTRGFSGSHQSGGIEWQSRTDKYGVDAEFLEQPNIVFELLETDIRNLIARRSVWFMIEVEAVVLVDYASQKELCMVQSRLNARSVVGDELFRCLSRSSDL